MRPPLRSRQPSSSGHAPAPSSSGHARAPASAGHAPAPSSSSFAPAPSSSSLAPGPSFWGHAPAPSSWGQAPAPSCRPVIPTKSSESKRASPAERRAAPGCSGAGAGCWRDGTAHHWACQRLGPPCAVAPHFLHTSVHVFSNRALRVLHELRLAHVAQIASAPARLRGCAM